MMGFAEFLQSLYLDGRRGTIDDVSKMRLNTTLSSTVKKCLGLARDT